MTWQTSDDARERRNLDIESTPKPEHYGIIDTPRRWLEPTGAVMAHGVTSDDYREGTVQKVHSLFVAYENPTGLPDPLRQSDFNRVGRHTVNYTARPWRWTDESFGVAKTIRRQTATVSRRHLNPWWESIRRNRPRDEAPTYGDLIEPSPEAPASESSWEGLVDAYGY